jgi:hypothetical protein
MLPKRTVKPLDRILDASIVISSGILLMVFLCCSYLAAGSYLPSALFLHTVPVMSNAIIRWDGRQLAFTDFGFRTSIGYSVPNNPPEVTQYYREEMAKAGWSLTRVNVVGRNQCLSFSRWGGLQVANIGVLGGFEGTGVTIDTAQYCSGFVE